MNETQQKQVVELLSQISVKYPSMYGGVDFNVKRYNYNLFIEYSICVIEPPQKFIIYQREIDTFEEVINHLKSVL
jgi:hypothetical protein